LALQIVSSLANLGEISQQMETSTDVIMLEVAGLCQAPVCPLSFEKIEIVTKTITAAGKKVFLLADMMVTESNLDLVKKSLERMLSVNASRIICYDFTFVVLADELGISNRLIYAPNTLITHSRLMEYYHQKSLAGLVISGSLSKEEMFSLCNNSQEIEMGVVLSGHREIYRSRRRHVTAYANHNGLDIPASGFYSGYAVREKQRENKYYPLVENENGTLIYDAFVLDPSWLTEDLALKLTYGFLQRREIDPKTYIEIINQAKKKLIMWQAGNSL